MATNTLAIRRHSREEIEGILNDSGFSLVSRSLMTRPLHLVFMGVSGSGKSTAALAVQERLGWEFAEGDDFHPPANVAKMRDGIPLTDADRWGWLEPLAADQAGMDVDPALPVDRLAAMVLARLGLAPAAS